MPTISGGSSGGIPGVTVSGTPAASQALIATSATAASWAYPPGFEIGYDQITAGVNLTGTTEGTATTVITCAAHTFDGGAVICDVYTLILQTPNNGVSDTSTVGLFESGTLINRLVFGRAVTVTAQQPQHPGFGAMRFTPSAGSHSYVLAGWVTNTTGTPQVVAGTGGPGNNPPAWVRFTKV